MSGSRPSAADVNESPARTVSTLRQARTHPCSAAATRRSPLSARGGGSSVRGRALRGFSCSGRSAERPTSVGSWWSTDVMTEVSSRQCRDRRPGARRRPGLSASLRRPVRRALPRHRPARALAPGVSRVATRRPPVRSRPRTNVAPGPSRGARRVLSSLSGCVGWVIAAGNARADRACRASATAPAGGRRSGSRAVMARSVSWSQLGRLPGTTGHRWRRASAASAALAGKQSTPVRLSSRTRPRA